MNSTQYFKKTIWEYYEQHKRILPWRETRNPYSIVVSEIMLQQTQVSRVVSKYKEFIKVFPSFQILAKASLNDILQVWSGMGYNRRAIYLKKIAEKVVKEFKGKLPQDPKILQTFPGIGKNTAGSIVSFAFNKPTVFIETNIRRVFIHFFFTNKEGVDDKDLVPLIKKTLDKKNSREWYYALMDYGAYLAKATENPNRKSKHYVIQSPLKGSNREVRGAILKELVQQKTVKSEQLFKLPYEKERINKALKSLVNEGFVMEKKGKYMIK